MINEQLCINSQPETLDERMVRLNDTLKGRLNLLNIFEPLINKSYKKMTINNIKINIKSEYEVVNFLLKNNDRIDYLNLQVSELLLKNGTQWQKSRIK